MNFDEKIAEEYYYENYPVTLNIGEEERKKAIINVFLAALKKGSQLDKVYAPNEGTWINRDSELEKKYDICIKEKATLKMHNAFVEKSLSEAKEIIQRMLRDIPNRMWYTDKTIKQAEQFLQEDNRDHFSQLCKIVRR